MNSAGVKFANAGPADPINFGNCVLAILLNLYIMDILCRTQYMQVNNMLYKFCIGVLTIVASAVLLYKTKWWRVGAHAQCMASGECNFTIMNKTVFMIV